jgi:hypothetical protein
MTAPDTAQEELATGWPVIVACAASAIFAWGFGAFGPAVYLAELEPRYGWPTATIGATTLAFIIGALLLPYVGAAIKRFGPQRVLTSGLLLIGAGVIGVSQVTAPWQLYGWNLLIGARPRSASSSSTSR